MHNLECHCKKNVEVKIRFTKKIILPQIDKMYFKATNTEEQKYLSKRTWQTCTIGCIDLDPFEEWGILKWKIMLL
jgi:hypothetical protein